MFQKVLYSVEGGIARATLNRPEKKNALDAQLVVELRSAVEAAGSDPAVRVVAVSGAGADFCSGADLAALERIAEAGIAENLEDARRLARLFEAMRGCPKPIVAVVRGRALAGGCGLATACDIVLAAESAQFGYPEVNIGFVPAMVMAMLRRAVAEKAAFELAAGGQPVSATRAAELGLVQRVYADDQFDAQSEKYITRLASRPPGAVSMTKSLLYGTDGLGFEKSLQMGAQINAMARMTEECREGVRRFLEKSKAR